MFNRPEKLWQLHQYLVNHKLLTDEEAYSVISFKNGRKITNENIRKGHSDEKEMEFCNSLMSGLAKLPKTNSKIVYRNLSFADFQLKNIKSYFKNHVNDRIYIPDFQSCTKLENFNGNVVHAYNCTFIIYLSQDTNATEIHFLWNEFDLNDVEQEVIFPMRSCFEILSMDVSKRLIVSLKELNHVDCPNNIFPNF
jgi:uncharacterized protein Veg